MARQTRARSTRSKATRGRQSRNNKSREDEVSEIYQEMLDEAEARDPEQFHLDRPTKRRRVGDTKAIPIDPPALTQSNPAEQPTSNQELEQQVQTVYDSTTEDESDIEWEDVDIQQPAQELPSASAVSQGRDETLQIIFDKEPEARKKTAVRRKPVTAAERRLRLDIHKTHLLCLLAHVNLRNRWCNDNETQNSLKRMLPKRIIALLHPDEDKQQYIRSTTFMDGLNQVADLFNRKFQVTKSGLKRAHWAEGQTQLKQRVESIMSDAEVFLSQADFRSEANLMQGSRDFGAQLFCALLRSVSIEARLVCSLQPLSFSGTVKDMTPSKVASKYIVISSDDYDTSMDERQQSGSSSTPKRPRRIGRPEFISRPPQSSTRPAPSLIPQESMHPVFWVEVFNEAVQKWFAIDPVVTKTLAKPSKFEPPASDPYNNMSYVVAFEDDASVRDVTRRYAKAFNAKNRKLRVESTKNGEEWWNKAMMAYEKPFLEDRDEAEISELTSKSAAEPMPRNIQDFKDHPVYAINRHLRRNEVVFPERVIGHVGLSKTTSKSDNLEPVYRRSDVHVVRSADKWYRLGRDVKVGEQPLKHVPVTRPKSGFASDEGEEAEHTPLYAEFQTDIYRPPPVVGGRIPKNAYGNLDIYVPSMVPQGAVHIKRTEASRAARILGVDFADAVTGFDFKGRRGTAVFGGIIIATEYQEALEEVLRSMEDERQHAAFETRSAEALGMWRLFLLKLRIAERVQGYATEDEITGNSSTRETSVDPPEGGGGFFPEPDQPTRSSPQKYGDEGHREALATEGGNLATPYPEDVSNQQEDDLGGGFIPEEPEEEILTPVSTINHPPPISQREVKPKAVRSSRYELVVVPHKSDTVMQDAGIASVGGFRNEPEGSSEKVPITLDSPANVDSKSGSLEIISRPTSPPQDLARSPPLEDSDSEIEKGSLLSEDPEDEDAIPDWLV
ncbi:hypothetical protein N7466_007792 [Penicillium verhagenii]|uniref:uncharacterized protein n=1 Tax=Penicillium verhagenii TaxID=1562060 RepID=UPI0025455C59|nr:uncharacterized protein N7466_007792 [Penicillium verhagenii]KAJ5928836.1 hypothetical protein N7466_007792 [Penicillium verhagenii]